MLYQVFLNLKKEYFSDIYIENFIIIEKYRCYILYSNMIKMYQYINLMSEIYTLLSPVCCIVGISIHCSFQ